MFYLQTLGALVLSDSAGLPVPMQRRRLALLAILASAGAQGLSRDKLIARLWSESPAENARHALEQLVYSVRRQFPPAGPLAGVDPLRLDSTIIESDVQGFRSALARGALGEAVTLYRGAFLDGFFLGDQSFEEWADQERSQLEGEHTAALHQLARAAGTERHHTEAIALWSKLAGIDPLSERSALGLARALAEAGDAPSALRQARAYAERVREELGVSPTPEHAAFVQRMLAAPAETEPLSSGSRDLGERYRIERELRRGSVARVYLARDTKHNRQVAIKVLRPEFRGSLVSERFLREISIVASLYHPHILQLYDSGVASGAGPGSDLYYVMPYVNGESLRERIDRDLQLSPTDAVRIAMEVASALTHAHARGIIHRDVKPENIMLEEGRVLLADFGIARALESAGGEKLSQSGIVLGTPSYMSPEQASGKRSVDGRSDIYSLGCVLYEMLAGEPPFTGRTTQALLARHASDPVPPLRTVCSDVSLALESAIARALAKAPEDRFASAADFAAALAPG